MLRIPTRTRAGSVGFSPDGALLAVAGPYQPGVRLFDSFDGRLVQALRPAGAGGPVTDAAFSPDGRLLAARYYVADHAVGVWDVATGAAAVLPGALARPAFDPVRSAVATVTKATDPGDDSAGQNPPARVWFFDPATGDPHAARLRPAEPFGDVLAVGFSPAGDRLTVAGGLGVRRFGRTVTGERAGQRWGATPPRWVEAAGTRSDAAWGWAAVADDGTVWAVRTHPAGRRTPTEHELLAVTADGVRPVVRVADTAGGPGGWLLRPAWAVGPDGRLAARADGSAVEVWETATGARVGRLDPGLGPVGCVAVAPDGLRAAAGGKSGVAVWDVGG